MAVRGVTVQVKGSLLFSGTPVPFPVLISTYIKLFLLMKIVLGQMSSSSCSWYWFLCPCMKHCCWLSFVTTCSQPCLASDSSNNRSFQWDFSIFCLCHCALVHHITYCIQTIAAAYVSHNHTQNCQSIFVISVKY